MNTLQDIQAAIRALPTTEVGPLHVWLGEYYHGEVWDRELEEDLARLGEEEFERRLSAGGDHGKSEVEKACLNLLDGLRFDSAAHREALWADLQLVISTARANADEN